MEYCAVIKNKDYGDCMKNDCFERWSLKMLKNYTRNTNDTFLSQLYEFPLIMKINIHPFTKVFTPYIFFPLQGRKIILWSLLCKAAFIDVLEQISITSISL